MPIGNVWWERWAQTNCTQTVSAYCQLRWSYGYADALQVFVRVPVYIRECFIIKIRDQVSPWYTDDITKDDREPLQTRGEHTLYCPLKAKHCGWTQWGPNCLPFQVFLCSYLSLPYMAWKGTESKAFDTLGGNITACMIKKISVKGEKRKWA